MSRGAVIALVALLLGSTTINYIDRQVLSVLAPLLRDEFHLSNSQYAGILNAFMLTYAVAMPAMGWVIDRLGVGRGLVASVSWWSAAGMLTALARGPLSMGLYRSLLAVGEAGAWPSFAKAVAIWVPDKWRTLAMGVCNSGSSLGAMIAPPLVVWVTARMGWQGAFLVTGSLGFLWVAAFSIFRWRHPEMRRDERGRASERQRPWRELLGYRQTWGIFFCRFFADPIWYFCVFWIPEFLARERGLNLAGIGAVAWIPFLISDISNFASGYVALRLERSGWSVNRTRKALMLGGVFLSPVGVAAAFAPTVAWTMFFICVAIFFWMGWSVTVQALAADFFPQESVARVYGFGGAGSTLGSMISIWAVGRTLDSVHSYVPVFIGLGILMPVAWLVGGSLVGHVHRLELPESGQAAGGA